MRRIMGCLVVCVGVLAPALTVYAQERTAIVSTTAPIYVLPDASRSPVRTAAANTELRVRGEQNGWLKVEFQDPQFGPRTGYVETRFVRIRDTALQPMDLSIKDPEPVRSREVVPQHQSATQPQQRASDRTASPNLTREGFWFNGGLGFGSLGCESCIGRVNGASGGLSLGTTVNDRLLLGVGTTGWYRSEDGIAVSVGTVDARIRFYPSVTSGFFLTAGVGLGTVSLGVADLGVGRETGVGVVLGLGWDVRVSSNVSLTPFWNGTGVSTANVNTNFGQFGLGVTIH